MNKPTRDKAFPRVVTDNAIAGCEGMDLRDYFAAQAMAALINRDGPNRDTVRDAYDCADQMMSRRGE